MGMDVYGKKPTSETGEYFRRSVWGWRPLARYVTEKHPTLTQRCKSWHSNDGAGLNAADSRRLAATLDQDVADGSAGQYVAERDRLLAAIPRLACQHCGGTGIRTDEVGRKLGQPERVIDEKWCHKPDHPRYGQVGWCNGCDGVGTVTDHATWYPLEVEDLREFAAFLRDCGGFQIC